MVDAGSIWIKLGLDPSELQFGLDKAKYSMQEWRGELLGGTAELGKWTAAIGVAVGPTLIAAGAAYEAAQKYGAMAQELNDLSITTRMTTDKLQQLQYAATLSDTPFQSVAFSISNLTIKMQEAADESSEAYKSFASIGVSTAGKTPDQVFDDVAIALSRIEDPAKRNAAANVLLGRSWREMVPYIEDYVENLDEVQKHEIISAEDLKTLQESKVALDKLGDSLDLYIAKTVVAGEHGMNWLYGAGEIAGTEISSSGMGYAGIYNYLTTGNKATLVEAAKRVLDPGAYTASAAKARAAAAKSSGSTPDAAVAAVTEMADPLAGLSAHDAEIKILKDYTIPDLEIKLKELQTSGTATYAEIAAASLEVINAKQELIDKTTEETEAQKELRLATNDLADAKQKLVDIETDYARKMSALNPRDVSAARSLIMQHKWDVEDQQQKIGGIQAKAGDLIINIDGKQLAKIPGVATTEGKMNLMQRGIS